MPKSKSPSRVVIDYESLPIEGRPSYPPAPVGVSIKWPGKKAKYWSWGHLDGNNCSWGEAQAELKRAYESQHQLLFQNAKFDIDVSEVHMGLPVPPWTKLEDSMFLLFLDDPHQLELGLKPSAERLLGESPDERDAVVDWLVANQPIPGIRLNRGKQGDHYAGAYVAFAPGDLTGEYANGDADRTEGLFELLYPRIVERGMLQAYDRERQLMPILLEMERQGIAVDLAKLKADVASYEQVAAQVDTWIIKKVKAPADINLDSGDQLMAAMLAAGVADESQALLTAGGKLSTSKESLLQAVSDKGLLGMLRYRAALKTCLGTFMKPWLQEATWSGGTISTSWNQVKSPAGDSAVGTRTGRLSASRFMNMPKEFNALWRHEDPANKKLPVCPVKGLPSLPWVRGYIVPFKGEVLIDRDVSQQEPRILAHFDGEALLQAYLDNPWIDFHDKTKEKLEEVGLFYERKPVKNTGLGLIYGMGAGKLAVKNDMSVEEAKGLRDAILRLYPGLKQMYKEMQDRARAHQPIRTWGGREYYCEEPKVVQGKLRHFDYKMVNVLVQGSAADHTKTAVINWDTAVKDLGKEGSWRLILIVHDQLTASVPKTDLHEAMEIMRRSIEEVNFDVPIRSEGSISDVNWASLKDYDKRGVRVL